MKPSNLCAVFLCRNQAELPDNVCKMHQKPRICKMNGYWTFRYYGQRHSRLVALTLAYVQRMNKKDRDSRGLQ